MRAVAFKTNNVNVHTWKAHNGKTTTKLSQCIDKILPKISRYSRITAVQ
jgi:hypothetical protein